MSHFQRKKKKRNLNIKKTGRGNKDLTTTIIYFEKLIREHSKTYHIFPELKILDHELEQNQTDGVQHDSL